MELWIRVQKNKKLKQGLVKVEDLMVDKDVEGKWCIYQSCDTLAIYKTEKRAMEVLDEIENILKPQTIVKSNKVIQKQDLATSGFELRIQPVIEDIRVLESSTYVYQMPEE